MHIQGEGYRCEHVDVWEDGNAGFGYGAKMGYGRPCVKVVEFVTFQVSCRSGCHG